MIVDELAPAEEIAPPSRVHWAFEGSMIDPEYSFATSHELRELLREAGFLILSERFLPPLPGVAERFDRHLTVIEARPA